MKARILAAILLMFTFTTAYNQTSRRGERNNDNKNNQQTERKEQNREATKPERTEPAKEENSVRRSNTTSQDSQRTGRVSRDNNTREQQQPQQQPTQTSRTGETRNQNRESSSRNETRNNRNDDKKRVVVREPERRTVVVHEYNREPQRKVIVRDNRREERTYVRIDRPVRKVVVVNHPKHYRPVSVEYRRVHKPYREPVHTHIYWSVNLHNDFRVFYPEVRMWRYDIGYRLPSVPAYDADYYIGDVARVYGKVSDIYYEHETDQYYLYFGDYFPYHDFSVVINGREARAFSRRPERFFRKAYLAVTGYITDYDEKPEIVVRRASQIEIY